MLAIFITKNTICVRFWFGKNSSHVACFSTCTVFKAVLRIRILILALINGSITTFLA
jgi:hypothetical protein